MGKYQKRSSDEITYTIIVAFAIIAFWRGVWGLMDLYFFPKQRELSFLLSILVGILILFLTKRLSTHLI